MPRRDSIDKVVEGYFAAVTTRPFVWRGVTIDPPPLLRVPSTILRGFTCPSGCGGCCPTFTLDYLPEPVELHPYPLTPRTVELDGREVVVWSDTQDDNRGKRCRNLNPADGRCGIHGRQPFSCDFELLGLQRHTHSTTLTTRLFSRGWAMHRTDGGVGNLCELIPATPEWRDDVCRRLRRLDTWAHHFGLTTCLPIVLDWIDEVGDAVTAGREVPDLRLRASRR